jgi:hypothetical protein
VNSLIPDGVLHPDDLVVIPSDWDIVHVL